MRASRIPKELAPSSAPPDTRIQTHRKAHGYAVGFLFPSSGEFSRRRRRWPPSMTAGFHRRLRPAIVAVLIALYIVGAHVYADYRNREFLRTDQNAYLNEIRKLKDTDYSRMTERSRMPVYLYVQSIAARKGMSNEELFPRAKWVNLIVSAIALLAVYAITIRVLPRVAADNLLLI